MYIPLTFVQNHNRKKSAVSEQGKHWASKRKCSLELTDFQSKPSRPQTVANGLSLTLNPLSSLSWHLLYLSVILSLFPFWRYPVRAIIIIGYCSIQVSVPLSYHSFLGWPCIKPSPINCQLSARLLVGCWLGKVSRRAGDATESGTTEIAGTNKEVQPAAPKCENLPLLIKVAFHSKEPTCCSMLIGWGPKAKFCVNVPYFLR